MVKEHRRRSVSSSNEDEDDQRHRYKKHRSRSPQGSRKRHKKHHHRNRSDSPESYKSRIKRESDSPGQKPKIKRDPVSTGSDSDSDSGTERKQHKKYTKRERPDGTNQGSRNWQSEAHRSRDYENPVRVKQEPDSEEEMRQQRAERRRNDQHRRENRHRREHLSEHERYGQRENQGNTETASESTQPKDQPDFKLSGKLTEDTNTYKGVVIKYNEPPEARKPKKRWRLYPFKNDEALKPFHMHRQSAYLFGRDRLIADIPVDHPSCSKQHAVFQYRMVPYEKEDGRKAYKIAPYIIDLESANGTFVNNKKIEARRYVELMEKDVIKFGFSSREYVLLHDKSSTAEVESDASS